MNKRCFFFSLSSLILGLLIGLCCGFYYCYYSWQDFWFSGIVNNVSVSTHALELFDSDKHKELRDFMINSAEQYIRITEPYLKDAESGRKAAYKGQIMAGQDILRNVLTKNKRQTEPNKIRDKNGVR